MANALSTARELKRKVAAWRNGRSSKREVAAAFRYDEKRYLAYSSTTGPFGSRENLAAKITERYHGVEKGLSLPEPRPGFGADLIATLIRLTQRYEREYGEDEITDAAWGALTAYLAANRSYGLADDAIPGAAAIAERSARRPLSGRPAGTVQLARAEVADAVSGVDLTFFSSRHSTRMFSDDAVADEDIEFAIAAGSTAPAVCNRQFTRVHVWTEPHDIADILAIQGGSRGFGAGIRALAMITVTQRAYWSPAERNQGWIDGGLFAMNFMLGLHARSLGSVPLNWSKVPAKDIEMRARTMLDASESIIMLVGIGHLRESYRVAASPRVQAHLVRHTSGESDRK